MQFELDLLDVVGHVFVLEWFDVDRPLVRVSVALPLLPEMFGHISVDDRLDHVHAFDPLTFGVGIARHPGAAQTIKGSMNQVKILKSDGF